VIWRIDCQRGTVEFSDLVPDQYRVCADGKACQDVEVLYSPALQRATLPPAHP
jgi:hypothetical protein